MAIQMRRGLRADFDPTQMLAGEWAVSVDASTANQIVWMCFGAGVVKRMGTYEDFESMIDAITDDIRDDLLVIKGEVEALADAVSDDADAVALAKTTIEQTDLPAIQSALASAQQSASDASASASSASQSASNASTSATTASEKAVLSQSWAEGGTNTRQGEDTNNAKYWAERAQSASFQQSDWTENDAQQSAYIAHKPFKTIGTGLSVDANGALNADGTSSYNNLTDKPSIGGTTLSGNKSLTDIGVPTWAQQQSKPSYTAQEVGALPDNTAIPSKTSDLTNDSGFLTSVPVATSQNAGAVKPDGSTTTVDANGVMSVIGGGGGGILPKLTVNSETGATVTATLGQQTITLTETTSGVYKGELPDLGEYTLTATKSGDTVTTTLDVNVVGSFEVNLAFFSASITVTYPSGATVTCSQTGQSTQTATGSPYTFTVHASGTWTITASVDGKTYTQSVNVTTSGQTFSYTLPTGSTVTPTDDVKTLVHCAGLSASEIDDLSDLFADSTTLLAVTSSHNAVDYLVRSKTFINKGLVPVMTSNTTPSGVCSASAEGSGHEAYMAFDGNQSTFWYSGSSGANLYLAYEFTTPQVIRKVAFSQMERTRTTSLKVEGYDGNGWVELGTFSPTSQSINPSIEEFTFNNNTAYSKARIVCVNSDNHNVSTVQFYSWAEGFTDNSTAMTDIGANNYCANTLLADSDWLEAICNSAYFESVLNVKVPTMTSNTTPSGICSASTRDGNAWQVFDGSGPTYWEPSANTNQWIGYEFTQSVKVYKVLVKPYGNYAPKTVKVQGYINNAWVDVVANYTLANTETEQTKIMTTISEATKWRLYCTDAYTTAMTIYDMQFYGRQDV